MSQIDKIIIIIMQVPCSASCPFTMFVSVDCFFKILSVDFWSDDQFIHLLYSKQNHGGFSLTGLLVCTHCLQKNVIHYFREVKKTKFS